MARKVMSVIPMIETNYQKFSPTERKVADFFLMNDQEVDMSAKVICQRMFVSEATLSRFAKKSGFSGYREFAFAYSQQIKSKCKPITNITDGVLSIYENLLSKEYEILDEAQLDRVAQYLGSYERVLVCGKGSSGVAASEMELRFMRLGVNIIAITHEDRMRMQSVFMDEKCLVIGFSISGNTEDVLYLLQQAHQRGAKTILVTAYQNDAFYGYCDEIILIPSYHRMDFGTSISPQFPILVVHDIIYTKFMQLNRLQKENLHENTYKALRKGENKDEDL